MRKPEVWHAAFISSCLLLALAFLNWVPAICGSAWPLGSLEQQRKYAAYTAIQQLDGWEKARPGVVADAGFAYIALGPCDEPDLDCNFLQEMKLSLQTLRDCGILERYPVAILTNGDIGVETLQKFFGEVVQVQVVTCCRNYEWSGDRRADKLRAYPEVPFNRTIFLDGDTYMLSGRQFPRVFHLLKTFDMAAVFECCQITWAYPGPGLDPDNFFAGGWEMQAGMIAFRKSGAMDEFWKQAVEEYEGRIDYYHGRSSGEQGALTMALGRSRVRFMPLPANFNLRQYTVSEWNRIGLALFHAHELHKIAEVNRSTRVKQLIAGLWDKASASFRKQAELIGAEPVPDEPNEPYSVIDDLDVTGFREYGENEEEEAREEEAQEEEEEGVDDRGLPDGVA